MSNNANTRRKVEMPGSVRSKFIAALCMLLVSAIMLISSTYAWFTLSTAPEVKGITTQVGANGNLEIALLNSASFKSDAEDLGIVSNIGDSMTVKEVKDANVTWGNLVDLGDTSYGLSNVMLMPAKLNWYKSGTDDAQTLKLYDSILLAPSYGNDGRVNEVKTPTYAANYNNGTAAFEVEDDAAGVRAIGTTSGVTLRISSYRKALTDASTAAANSRAEAGNSLRNNAQGLASMLINYAMGNATVLTSDLATLDNVVSTLASANDYVLTAIKKNVLAYNLSAANTDALDDASVEAMITLSETADYLDETVNPTVKKPNGYTEAMDNYNAVKAQITTIQTKLAAIDRTGDTVAWSDGVLDVFDLIVNRTGTTVAGVPATSDKQAIIDACMSNITSGINITFGANSGIYYDISLSIGSLSTSTQITVNYGGLTVNNLNTVVSTNIGANTPTLTDLRTNAAAGAPEENAGGSKVTLGDTYGYAIDFGFRTNAATSNLLLQTAAAQRVYSESESDATQGIGSNLLFTTNDTVRFTLEDVKALMSAVRVAFVAPKVTTATSDAAPAEGEEAGATTTTTTVEYELLAMAKLDVKNTAANGEAPKYTRHDGSEITEIGNNGVKADLYLCDYTFEGDNAEGGTVHVGDIKTDRSAITNLDANKAKKVTVIVYLDGEIVDNTMVANADSSVTGALNLQFSSSATLVPMTNSSLMAAGKVDTNNIQEYTVPAETMNALKEQFPVLNSDSVKFYKTKDGVTPEKYYYSLDNGATYTAITLPETP